MTPGTTTATVKTPRQQERRGRILLAAQELLVEREYEQVQVRDVAERAEVALGTLYRYFPSKELLYAHVLLSWSETFEERIRARNRSADSSSERLRALMHGVVRSYERSPNFFRLVTLLEVTPDPAVQEVFAQFGDSFNSVLLSELERPGTDEAEAGGAGAHDAAAESGAPQSRDPESRDPESRDSGGDDSDAIAFVAGSALITALRAWAQRGAPISSVYERIDSTVDLLADQIQTAQPTGQGREGSK